LSGVYLATDVTTSAVRSYRTISPLPIEAKLQQAVYFLLHLPSVYTAQALPGTLLYKVRTFLSLFSLSQKQAATVQLTLALYFINCNKT